LFVIHRQENHRRLFFALPSPSLILPFLALILAASPASAARQAEITHEQASCLQYESIPAPRYRIANRYKIGPEPTLMLYVSISPADFEREKLLSLSCKLSHKYANEQALQVQILDSFQAAKHFPPLGNPRDPLYAVYRFSKDRQSRENSLSCWPTPAESNRWTQIDLGDPPSEPTESNEKTTQEQSTFGLEDPPITKPIAIPGEVLQILRTDKIVQNHLNEGQTPADIPASWFEGSQIHLDGSDELDLVVVPKNGLLFGANVGPIWVFHKTAKGYDEVLSISVHDLRVLKTKWKGFREIQVYSMTAVTVTTEIFRFDGQRYVSFNKVTKPIN
jgi:hypothetical protein